MKARLKGTGGGGGPRRTPGRVMGLKQYAGLLVKAALAEDIGSGDVTTGAVVRPSDAGEAVIIAKEEMTLAGLFLVEQVFKELDRKISARFLFKDGDIAGKGKVIARISGPLAPILSGERVALNFLQRMSGIATMTRRFADKTKCAHVRVLDTRKTTPCMRLIERYAVRAGGGDNHRFGLFDAVLVKDNHIKAAGGVAEALKRAGTAARDGGLIEVEVKTLKEVREALDGGADIIMLDNMGIGEMKKAAALIDKRALVEASGGVTLDNVAAIAGAGVDFISVGCITHSAPAVDISMEVVSVCGKKRGRKRTRESR